MRDEHLAGVMLFRWLAVAVSVSLTCAGAIRVTNPPAIKKVLPTAKGAGREAGTLRIAMSRGEYEPVQLVVHAGDEPLRGVRVSVSDLAESSGAKLPQTQLSVTPLGYITCTKPTYGWAPLLGEKGGEVPDVLLPDRPMDVPAGRRQPYYITVQTLPNDAAGEYRGTVRVSAQGEEPRELPLLVRVYDLVLPVKPHLRTAFGMDTGYRKLAGANPGQDMDTLLRYSKFLLQHRVSPLVYGSSVENTNVFWRESFWRDDGTWDSSGVDRYLSELVPLGLTSFYTCWMAGVRVYADHLKSRGWWDLAYAYGHDEAPMDRLPKMRQDYAGIQRAVADVRAIQVGWSPVKPLEGLVKMWCPLLSSADTLALQRARERGEEAWWYVCNVPRAPFPNFSFVDYPGIHGRITGWMTYHYGIQGFLYYAVDIWDTHPNQAPGGRLSVEEYDRANYANWDADTYKKDRTGNRPRNGCGWLLYPGKDNTPIASMRLAILRDGFEDYDVFTEVAALATGDSEADARARELLDFTSPFDNPIILSREKWTKAANLLMQRREEILRIAEELRQPDDPRLQALRTQTDLDALYYEKKKESAFGATPPDKARYADGTDYAVLFPKLGSVADLPLEGWLFKDDPENAGAAQGFYKPDYPTDGLPTIEIGKFWDAQGYPGLEQGWYRLLYTCPELPAGKRVFLHFGAMDESAWVYIDGELVAWYDTAYPILTWEKPFLLDVTGSLESGAEHLLVVHVGNTIGAGGIYKPVSLMVEK